MFYSMMQHIMKIFLSKKKDLMPKKKTSWGMLELQKVEEMKPISKNVCSSDKAIWGY